MVRNYFEKKTERIKSDLLTLAAMTNEESPGYTRNAFTPEYKESRKWLETEIKKCGLDVRVDAASNLIGRLEGLNKNLPPIMIGSHTDTVTGGGRFDGIIGVLAGIEIIRQLKEKNIRLNHTLYIVDFTAEESNDFGISTIGSRGMVNNLTKEMLDQTDRSGEQLSEAIERIGGRPDYISKEAFKAGDLSLYLELHIEQGPVLEETGNDLGVVTGIVGNQRYEIEIVGQPNHSGTTPMHARADALTAASEIILAVEQIASRSYEEEVVGTVGRLVNEPNGTNIVPGRVVFDVEFRSLSLPLVKQLMAEVKEVIQKVMDKRRVMIHMNLLSQSDPVFIKEEVIEGLGECCRLSGKTIRLPSGAGHDANQLSRVTDVGMIFVPSKNGKSHCPEEWTEYEQVATGVQALGDSLIYFDQQMSSVTNRKGHMK